MITTNGKSEQFSNPFFLNSLVAAKHPTVLIFFFHHLIDVLFFLLIILQFHFLNYNFDFIHSFEAANIRSNVYAIK